MTKSANSLKLYREHGELSPLLDMGVSETILDRHKELQGSGKTVGEALYLVHQALEQARKLNMPAPNWSDLDRLVS